MESESVLSAGRRIAVRALALIAASTVGLAACNKGKSAAELEPSASATARAVDVSATAAPRFDEASFRLEMSKVGTYEKSAAGKVEVQLEAKAPYHVNEKYPIKLKLEPTDGVKFDAETLGRDQVAQRGGQAVMTVGFTPETAGSKRIAGKLKFSVCSQERCLMETRELALVVNVE
jgi:hypothetical protein